MLSLASAAACTSARGVSTRRLSCDSIRQTRRNTTYRLHYRLAYHALIQLHALRHASPLIRSARVPPYTPQSTMWEYDASARLPPSSCGNGPSVPQDADEKRRRRVREPKLSSGVTSTAVGDSSQRASRTWNRSWNELGCRCCCSACRCSTNAAHAAHCCAFDPGICMPPPHRRVCSEGGTCRLTPLLLEPSAVWNVLLGWSRVRVRVRIGDVGRTTHCNIPGE